MDEKQFQNETSKFDDNSNLSFVSWNIKKGTRQNSYQDLIKLSEGKDFVLLQEAVLDPELFDSIGDDIYWNFSKGYQKKLTATGVMTASKHKPLSYEEVICWEPWLGTPKATSISVFDIPDLDNVLMIINIHSINFTLGTKHYLRQIERIHDYLIDHSGPIILSGDFNTWRKKRLRILNELAMEHELEPIAFEEDNRKKVFGQRLDHIYVRSLALESANAPNIKSSDHSPLTASFSVN